MSAVSISQQVNLENPKKNECHEQSQSLEKENQPPQVLIFLQLSHLPEKTPTIPSMADDDFYHHGKHPNLGNNVMLIVFSSLFFFLLLLTFVAVYFRCVLARRARRRALIHHLNTHANADQTHVHEPPKTGLDASVIAALPTFIYKKTGTLNESGAECAVCLSVLEEKETARILPNCKHVFHAHCIDAWLQSHTTCPICRTGASPKAPEAAEPAASAPPLDRSVSMGLEGTSGAVEQTSKEGGSFSRLSSFRRILSREESERRRRENEGDDLERQ